MNSAACARPERPLGPWHRPPTLRRAVAGLQRAWAPPRAHRFAHLFDRLRILREHRDGLAHLVELARTFTPDVAARVEALAASDPDEALLAFATAFQRTHFELDETVYWDGFETWLDSGAAEFIPLLMRGHDRCNGLEAEGGRPGLMLLWALLQDVWWGDERSRIIADTVETFGEQLADRLQAAEPPEHQTLCRRLANSPYAGMAAFSCWVLGDVDNDLLVYHAHHADELRLPWTPEGVAQAQALVQDADAYQAPIDALIVWLERDPARHGPLLVDAVLGREHTRRWAPSAVQPCARCGYPSTTRPAHSGPTETSAANELSDNFREELYASC